MHQKDDDPECLIKIQKLLETGPYVSRLVWRLVAEVGAYQERDFCHLNAHIYFCRSAHLHQVPCQPPTMMSLSANYEAQNAKCKIQSSVDTPILFEIHSACQARHQHTTPAEFDEVSLAQGVPSPTSPNPVTSVQAVAPCR